MAISNGVTGGNFTSISDLQSRNDIREGTVVTVTTGGARTVYSVDENNLGNGVAVNGLFANPVNDSGTSRNFYVNSSTGNDNNDGTEISPFLTIQKAIDEWAAFCETTATSTTIFLSGAFTEGALASDVNNISELTVDGVNKAATSINGTSATNINGLNFNFCNRIRVKNLTVTNFSRDGIVFQNGTTGVIDTCDANNNDFADFDCNEFSEMVVIGSCSIGSGSDHGLRYYGNSNGSVGDGTNTILIDNANLYGIYSRNGSIVVCDDNLTIQNVNTTTSSAGIRLSNNAFIEIRDSTIQNNTIGIFAESNCVYDENGTITFTGNTNNKRIVAGAIDRSVENLSSNVPYYLRPSTGTPTGESPSSNYDMVFDKNGVTGIQFLTNDNTVNFDVNKTQRVAFNADGSIRIVTENNEAVRLDGTPTANQTGLLLLVNDGTTTSLRRVEVGAADSGGSGSRALIVDN